MIHQLARLAGGGAEEIAVDVIGDARRWNIIVQALIEPMITGERRAPCCLWC
jgi:hypothetical protein